VLLLRFGGTLMVLQQLGPHVARCDGGGEADLVVMMRGGRQCHPSLQAHPRQGCMRAQQVVPRMVP
jgi:hypothetical protein